MQGATLAALKEKAMASDLNVLDLSILIIFFILPKNRTSGANQSGFARVTQAPAL